MAESQSESLHSKLFNVDLWMTLNGDIAKPIKNTMVTDVNKLLILYRNNRK